MRQLKPVDVVIAGGGFVGLLGSGLYVAYRAGHIENSVIALQKDSTEGKADLKAQLEDAEAALGG